MRDVDRARTTQEEQRMAHLVTAIIKPFKLEEVKEALRAPACSA